MMNPLSILFALLCACISLYSTESPRIAFKVAEPYEVEKIEERCIAFYAESLIKAGILADQEMALIAASKEVNTKDYKEKHTYYLLDESSDPCGYIVYSISNDDDAYLEAIYLENTYRGKGLGKEALKQLEQELIKKSIKLIKLLVFAYNEPAFRLYKGMGYEIENSYFHEGKPISHHMTKKIL